MIKMAVVSALTIESFMELKSMSCGDENAAANRLACWVWVHHNSCTHMTSETEIWIELMETA